LRLAAAALALAAFASPASAQDPALRLEMLAERAAKLHAQVGQGILAERSRRALAEALREFDAGLKEVQSRPAGAEIRDNYILLGLLWSEYRAWALKPATRDNAKKLAERAEEVAWVAAKGARLEHEPGRKGTGRLALEAAHAAMLSQRLARLYLTQRWDVKQESAGRAIPGVVSDLQATVERLRTAPQNTPEIVTELQAAEGQMGFLLQGGSELLGKRAGGQVSEFVAKSADHMLEAMERVERLYEGG
jgi:hypothetical protein